MSFINFSHGKALKIWSDEVQGLSRTPISKAIEVVFGRELALASRAPSRIRFIQRVHLLIFSFKRAVIDGLIGFHEPSSGGRPACCRGRASRRPEKVAPGQARTICTTKACSAGQDARMYGSAEARRYGHWAVHGPNPRLAHRGGFP